MALKRTAIDREQMDGVIMVGRRSPDDSGSRLVAVTFDADQLNAAGAIRTVVAQIDHSCSSCAAKGCLHCQHNGYVSIPQEVRFRVPAGIHYGTKIRLAGQGSRLDDGSVGDLYIDVVPPVTPIQQPANDHFVNYAARVPSADAPTFDASRIPAPGDLVPRDCVWSRIPYPGPLPKAARKWLSVSRVMNIDPVARPLNQLISVLGQPSARSEHPDGTFTLQWEKTTPARGNSYHIVLSFDRYGVCGSLDHRWIDS